MEARACLTCGNLFKPDNSQRKYCSNICSAARYKTGQNITCLNCGKSFYQRGSRVVGKKYCSAECMYSSPEHLKTLQRLGKERVNKMPRTCIKCGTIFYIHPSYPHQDRQYCSKKCMFLPPVEITCEECGIVFVAEGNRAERTHYCSKACLNAAKRRLAAQPEGHEALRARAHKGLVVQQQQGTRTSIERAMADALTRANITFIEQQPIGYFIADFLIPDAQLVIECDGDYWHALPGRITSDKRKNTFLKNRGYTVLRFSETAIKQDVDACVHTIVSLVTQARLRIGS